MEPESDANFHCTFLFAEASMAFFFGKVNIQLVSKQCGCGGLLIFGPG